MSKDHLKHKILYAKYHMEKGDKAKCWLILDGTTFCLLNDETAIDFIELS